jgi:hypothetical protein
MTEEITLDRRTQMKKWLGVLIAGLLSVAPAWATLMEGRYGDQPGSQNAQGEVPQSKASGAVYTADRHGKYMLTTLGLNHFYCANQAAIASGAGIAVAAKNLTLVNPQNSGKNLVIDEIIGNFTVLAASAAWFSVAPSSAVILQYGAPTVEKSGNAFLGGVAPVAYCYNTVTLPYTPVIVRQLASVMSGAAQSNSPALSYAKDDVAGALVVPPGFFLSIQATAAASGLWSVTWEEVPAF